MNENNVCRLDLIKMRHRRMIFYKVLINKTKSLTTFVRYRILKLGVGEVTLGVVRWGWEILRIHEICFLLQRFRHLFHMEKAPFDGIETCRKLCMFRKDSVPLSKQQNNFTWFQLQVPWMKLRRMNRQY